MTDHSCPWWGEAVLYQIYPRSFADSDGDGIGDLNGITTRLDHVAALGADAIWLSPFYPSPQADFGYDVSEYCDVDPRYGTLAAFERLVEEARERGLRVVVDLVMNHTSTEHEWFRQARSSRENPYRDWYVWADPREGGPPNNWLSAFERCGPAWTFDEPTGQYYLHSFTPGQPDLNWRNPKVLEAMREVWRFWLDRGVAGFRVDVAHRLLKDGRLRDNPGEIAHERRHVSHPTLRQRNLDLPEVHDVLRELRRTLDEYGAFALGEVPISDDARLAEYFGRDGMQTAFHIAFWEQPWQAKAFRTVVDRLARHATGLPTYALATHDIPRTVTRYGTRERAAVAAVMQLTLRGMPCVYYGEELGTADAPPAEDLDVDGRDGTRVPMAWDNGTGFTTGTPWLPVPLRGPAETVAGQEDDPGSLLNLYRRLIRLRRSTPALRTGGYRSLDAGEDVFAYVRFTADERLLVALNFTAAEVTVRMDDLPFGQVALSTRLNRGGPVDPRALTLGPDEGLVVRLPGGAG